MASCFHTIFPIGTVWFVSENPLIVFRSLVYCFRCTQIYVVEAIRKRRANRDTQNRQQNIAQKIAFTRLLRFVLPNSRQFSPFLRAVVVGAPPYFADVPHNLCINIHKTKHEGNKTLQKLYENPFLVIPTSNNGRLITGSPHQVSSFPAAMRSNAARKTRTKWKPDSGQILGMIPGSIPCCHGLGTDIPGSGSKNARFRNAEARAKWQLDVKWFEEKHVM